MRAANALVAEVLAELATMVAPGVTTRDLDHAAEKLVRDGGAEPAFKGYRDYPSTLCASVNDQVVHGIPSNRALYEGDIISLDMGVKLNGFFGDSAVTVPVGKVSEDASMLLRVTRESLEMAIEKARPAGVVEGLATGRRQHNGRQGGQKRAFHEAGFLRTRSAPGGNPAASQRCRISGTSSSRFA